MSPLRFISHIGLLIISIYVFCFASSLWGSSWTNWLWALGTGFLLFFSLGVMFIDDGDDKMKFENKHVVCCIDSLCIASMLIKIFTQTPEAQSIILLIVILFVMEIGINRMALSHFFGWTSLFMVWPYVNFHSWIEIVGFVVLCLVVVGLVISSSIYQYNQEEEEDEDVLVCTSIANFVLVSIIMSGCLLFINHRVLIGGQLPDIGHLYLAYCILGLIVGFTNNKAALVFSIAAGICYFAFLSTWSVSLDWSLYGTASIWEWISSFFITLWHWIVWGAIHLWDGIVWCVVGLWKCIVWPFTHLWNWLTSVSLNLTWNWNLFSFTWCSVIMWGGIILGVFISTMLLIGLFVENGLHAIKYIAHSVTSLLIIYEFAFANVPEDAHWWYWLFFSIGILIVFIEYRLIFEITRGNINNGIVSVQVVISLLLSLCLCYKLYVNSEPAYMLIISIVACILCSSFNTIIQGAVSSVSNITRNKPAMEYRGTSMTCPYCRENYMKQWVIGTQIKGTSRAVVKTGIKVGARFVGLTTGAVAGAKAGAAVGMVGGPPGAAIGALIGGAIAAVGTWAVNKQINKAVDYGYDQINSEYGDGNDWEFKCPECGHVWYKKEKNGEIVH